MLFEGLNWISFFILMGCTGLIQVFLILLAGGSVLSKVPFLQGVFPIVGAILFLIFYVIMAVIGSFVGGLLLWLILKVSGGECSVNTIINFNWQVGGLAIIPMIASMVPILGNIVGIVMGIYIFCINFIGLSYISGAKLWRIVLTYVAIYIVLFGSMFFALMRFFMGLF